MAFFFGHFSINVGKDFKREKEKDMKEVCTNFNGNIVASIYVLKCFKMGKIKRNHHFWKKRQKQGKIVLISIFVGWL